MKIWFAVMIVAVALNLCGAVMFVWSARENREDRAYLQWLVEKQERQGVCL